MTFYPFPSIDQFRNVIRSVKDTVRYAGRDSTDDPIFNHDPLPTIRFRGTVKLHGTNAAIVREDGVITYQSRSRVLTLDDDNAGFAGHMNGCSDTVQKIFDQICTECLYPKDFKPLIKIFGEWCGGNIQKGVAINGLPKMFVVFAIKIDETWVDIERFSLNEFNVAGIYNILQFGAYFIDIDFERPEAAQNKLGELTLDVEKECPAGKYFGNPGIGEGIVWKPVDYCFWNDSKFTFKVKGEEHSTSKVKTLAAVDVEAADSLRELIDSLVTPARLEQGISVMQERKIPLDMKSLGEYLRWVYNDIVKEDADTIVASGYDPKKLGSPIANKARPFYIRNI